MSFEGTGTSKSLGEIAPGLRVIRGLGGNTRVQRVTTESLRIATEEQAAYDSRPVLAAHDALYRKLSGCFITSGDVTQSMIDRTGVRPKLLFALDVETDLESTDTTRRVNTKINLNRKILLSVGIPTSVNLGVCMGDGVKYSTPAISETIFQQDGSWNEKKGQINWYNRIAPLDGTFLSAAFFEMALFYIQDHFIPSVTGRGQPRAFPDVPAYDSKLPIPADMRALMPQELAGRLSTAALNILYHALNASTVLAMAGYPVANRVCNMAGRINRCVFEINAFFEALEALFVTACGSGSRVQAHLDFLLPFIQLLPAHGITDEGGAWRRLWSRYPIQTNTCVAITSHNRQTTGYYNLTSMQLVASAVTMQSVVSRSIFESHRDMMNFICAPACPDSDLTGVLNGVVQDIRCDLAAATGAHVSYFQHYLRAPNARRGIIDRHINPRMINIFKSACPFAASYTLIHSGDRAGQVQYSADGGNPIVFNGDTRIERGDLEGTFVTRIGLSEQIDLSNGLCWLHPCMNIKGNLGDATYYGVATENQNMHSSVNLIDGNRLTQGSRIGDYFWMPNNDLFPPTGELRTLSLGNHLVELATVPAYADKGRYTMSLSKYFVVYAQPGELNKPGFTRTDIYLKNEGFNPPVPPNKGNGDGGDGDGDHSHNRKKAPSGGNFSKGRPVYTDTKKFLREHKKLYDRTLNMEVLRLQQCVAQESKDLEEEIVESGLVSREILEGNDEIEFLSAALMAGRVGLLRDVIDQVTQDAITLGEEYLQMGGIAMSHARSFTGGTVKHFHFITPDDVSKTQSKIDNLNASTQNFIKDRASLVYGYDRLAIPYDYNRYLQELLSYNRDLAIIENNLFILSESMEAIVLDDDEIADLLLDNKNKLEKEYTELTSMYVRPIHTHLDIDVPDIVIQEAPKYVFKRTSSTAITAFEFQRQKLEKLETELAESQRREKELTDRQTNDQLKAESKNNNNLLNRMSSKSNKSVKTPAASSKKISFTDKNTKIRPPGDIMKEIITTTNQTRSAKQLANASAQVRIKGREAATLSTAALRQFLGTPPVASKKIVDSKIESDTLIEHKEESNVYDPTIYQAIFDASKTSASDMEIAAARSIVDSFKSGNIDFPQNALVNATILLQGVRLAEENEPPPFDRDLDVDDQGQISTTEDIVEDDETPGSYESTIGLRTVNTDNSDEEYGSADDA